MRFLIKDESNKLRQEEFLAISGEDRFLTFLNLSRRVNQLSFLLRLLLKSAPWAILFLNGNNQIWKDKITRSLS